MTRTTDEAAGLMRPREAASGDLPLLDAKGKPVLGENGKPLTEPWVLNPNDLYEPDHPVVQGWPHLFKPAAPTVRTTSAG